MGGFSLLEIVVSLALLGLIVGLVINILPSSIVASHGAGEQMEAENLAQSLVEEARAAGLSNLTVGVEDIPSPDPKFKLQREIFVPAGADAGQTVGVRVIVRWESKKRQRELKREI
ncbi:MAG: type II secretion system protein [Vulcanimicrobiota bacterium]